MSTLSLSREHWGNSPETTSHQKSTPLNLPTYWNGYLHVELWRCVSCDCNTSDYNNVAFRCVYIPSGFLLDNGTTNADRKKYDWRPSEQLTTNKLTWVWLICSADVRIKNCRYNSSSFETHAKFRPGFVTQWSMRTKKAAKASDVHIWWGSSKIGAQRSCLFGRDMSARPCTPSSLHRNFHTHVTK